MSSISKVLPAIRLAKRPIVALKKQAWVDQSSTFLTPNKPPRAFSPATGTFIEMIVAPQSMIVTDMPLAFEIVSSDGFFE